MILAAIMRMWSAASPTFRWTSDSGEDGATAVEYGLMVALIAIVIITAVALVGTNLKAVFETVQLHTALN